MRHKAVDFDEYADKYEKILSEQLSFFSSDREYFSAYKIELLSTLVTNNPERILDFGCGIGLSLPHFRRYFPEAELYATDISTKSLDYVNSQYPYAIIVEDNELEQFQFDLVFLSGVVHHVAPEQRLALFQKLQQLITLDGIICIFEHNPYNPVTRKMVSTCPFDKGVELWSMGKTLRLLRDEVGLFVKQKGYCLFFPETLSMLRRYEVILRWLPLGGQYYIMAGVH